LYNDLDFGVIEKKKGKVPYVYSQEGCHKLVENASKKTVFIVIRLKGKGFVTVAEVQQKLVLHSITTAGERVQHQKAERFRITSDIPGSYFIAYTHNPIRGQKDVSLTR
jgi:hypothetical protein